MKKLNLATRAVLTDALNDYRNRDKLFTLEESYDIFDSDSAWTLKVNWSCIGSTDAGKARLFAVNLAEAANFAVRVNALDIRLVNPWGDPSDEDRAFYHEWKNTVANYVYSSCYDALYDWLVENLED
jgi:hypothetical protein